MFRFLMVFDLDIVLQSDSTGKLGFHEFKHLWNNIKKWQVSRERNNSSLKICICDFKLDIWFN